MDNVIIPRRLVLVRVALRQPAPRPRLDLLPRQLRRLARQETFQADNKVVNVGVALAPFLENEKGGIID